MLISHSHSLLYIHIQKTAGTSLSRYLRDEIADLQDFLRPHDPLVYAQRTLGASFCKYTKVGFVRNPFDRLVSWYSMISAHGKALSEREITQNPNYNRIWQYVLTHSSCFEEFIVACSRATDRSGWKPFLFNQTDYFKTSDGIIDADFIGRFEHLDKDFGRLCGLLGISHRRLPHVNKSNHLDYRSYYSDKSRAIVEQRFAEDLDYFGYTF
ncbi:sulfotransferase family 2 domain-containing protein [Alteromonas oceanisediminis]|uniref:sulfotransferase family 2 domain-containing protein n=1 Tax=Alteromonas oceanisediminis TaxID=2836180 RepID=UPI001BD9A6B0|nr:sulfotransferase family 2 domain-containing protein [Alteromonas oceanisediminis]MBT0585056.1 sulfotransferase family 2 domain-containing protein [Alteromonas oceanisediminis]